MISPAAVTASLLTLTALAVAAPAWRGPVAVGEKTLARISPALGAYRGEDDRFDAGVYRVLNADDTLLRLYESPDTFHWLFIAYFGTEKGGRTGHMPRHCYPGAGYRVLEEGKAWVATPAGRVRVNRLVVQKGDERSSVLHWMQNGGAVVDNGWRLNWTRFRRRLSVGRDDGAFVRISSPATEDPAAQLSRQTAFAAQVMGALAAHWPAEHDS